MSAVSLASVELTLSVNKEFSRNDVVNAVPTNNQHFLFLLRLKP